MDRKIILKKLAEICLIPEETVIHLDDEDSLIELGLDSLNLISFIVRIEEDYDIEMLDSDLIIDKFATVGDMFHTLEHYFQHSQTMKKCLILDCDNVLWKGISGEDEILIDEDIVYFQGEIKNIRDKGILLCLCSRNDDKLVMKSLRHPNMQLNEHDFIITKIDQRNKAIKITEIAEELNLSTDSFVFVDDSDYEIGLINHIYPEIKTVKVNFSDRAFIADIVSCFDIDLDVYYDRTKLYRDQKERIKERQYHFDIKSYNESLCTETIFEVGSIDNIARCVELSQRTNQFNLSNRHYTNQELQERVLSKEYSVISMSVRDKYGDMGIVGLAVVINSTIEAFILSCRVFDRGFENELLDRIKQMTSNPLTGIYCNNGKNSRFASFYGSNGIRLLINDQ